ncbi:TadE/TadG family type IV pilus assembly protein [Enterovirga rhinocerotis]|uniref:TadE-like protein n=1 Tax=Enterovirga rhinocerotis TaxID=1339210 RepID=A0A4R7BGZ6_9HYPH|nr:TadE/TadG family type IV pilus assembly protein [Enterovirga rhinocerotis]TDR84530.1 TadE-like protein [Enterovirga rhinocerotis]
MSVPSRIPHRLRGAIRNDQAVAAVEFALIVPLFCLLTFGIVDFGGVLATRFRLDAAVSSAANFSLVNAPQVTSSDGARLAESLAKVVESSSGRETTSGTITVNNGPVAAFTGSEITASGTASAADRCYCPSASGGAITWGATKTCGAVCDGGGLAGKFVSIEARQTYSPFFSSYGIVRNGEITTRAVIQTQ